MLVVASVSWATNKPWIYYAGCGKRGCFWCSCSSITWEGCYVAISLLLPTIPNWRSHFMHFPVVLLGCSIIAAVPAGREAFTRYGGTCCSSAENEWASKKFTAGNI